MNENADAEARPPGTMRDSNRKLTFKLLGLGALMIGLPGLLIGWYCFHLEDGARNSMNNLVGAFSNPAVVIDDLLDHDVAVKVESLNTPVLARNKHDQAETKYEDWEAFVAAYSRQAQDQPKVWIMLNAQGDRKVMEEFSDLLEGRIWRAGARRVRVTRNEQIPQALGHRDP